MVYVKVWLKDNNDYTMNRYRATLAFILGCVSEKLINVSSMFRN